MYRRISILLPSLRESMLKEAIKEIRNAEPYLDYEIIVVSPFKVKGFRVVWVEDFVARGPVYASNLAFNNSSGDFIVTWADDLLPSRYCISTTLEFLLGYKGLTAVAFTDQFHSRCYIYGHLYTKFGVFPRKLLNLLGDLYNPEFTYHWADSDLSLRIYMVGGEVLPCPSEAYVTHKVTDNPYASNLFIDSLEVATKKFLDEWHASFGGDIPKEKVLQDITCINTT